MSGWLDDAAPCPGPDRPHDNGPHAPVGNRCLKCPPVLCDQCGNRIGDYPNPSVSARRRRAQLSIERTQRTLLLSPHKTDDYLADLGHTMRTVSERNNIKRERVKARLGWPGWDEHYDLRAFQRSGIDDPISLGLCDERSLPLRAEYRDVA